MPLIHWITAVYYAVTGAANELGKAYGFWSGFGGSWILGYIGLSLLYLYHHNCHQKGCPFPGKYPAVEGGGWKYCKKHHANGGKHI